MDNPLQKRMQIAQNKPEMDMGARDALEILRVHYDSFINSSVSADFFNGLARYVARAQSMSLTKRLIDALENEMEAAKLSKSSDDFERSTQIEPWGAWPKLSLVKTMVFEARQIIKNTEANWLQSDGWFMAEEMEHIRSREGLPDDETTFFAMKDYRTGSETYKVAAQIFHSFIVGELLKNAERLVYFNPKTNFLFFGLQEMPLKGNQAAVCAVMFEKYVSREIASIEDVCKATGEYSDEGSPSWVRTAALEINIKTNKQWGFSIFSTPRGALQLKFPNKTLREQETI